MIYILHLFLALNLSAAAFAGAINFQLARKAPSFAIIYYGWSLLGQIFALPLLLLTIGSLVFAYSRLELSSLIVILNIAALAFFAYTLLQSWQGSIKLCQVVPDGTSVSISRFLIGALFPLQLSRRDVKRLKNIAYGPSGKKNQLDIYMPKSRPSSPMPVLVHVHGGGWVMGRKHQQAQPLIQHMASKGWLVVDINYRLAPKNKMPAMIQDVLLAVAWVKANIASYHGNPDFVALTGGSAGGHLVALAGVASGVKSFTPGFEQTDCSVNACVPMYGLYDFLNRSNAIKEGFNEVQSFMTKLVMPKPPLLNDALWENVSPLSHIHADAPPMLIMHGRHDMIADFEGAKAFAEILDKTSNNRVIFVDLPGGQHAFDIAHAPPTPEHISAVYRFLENVRLESERQNTLHSSEKVRDENDC